jgi:hypothetical protein
MNRQAVVRLVLVGVVATVSSWTPARAQEKALPPETVMITLHAKAGAEAALAQVVARHYETARRLMLLRDEAPHLTLRAPDDHDTVSIVEIFTWRDAATPDHAPREIQAIWQEMNGLVEARGGRPGLDIVEVRDVTQAR